MTNWWNCIRRRHNPQNLEMEQSLCLSLSVKTCVSFKELFLIQQTVCSDNSTKCCPLSILLLPCQDFQSYRVHQKMDLICLGAFRIAFLPCSSFFLNNSLFCFFPFTLLFLDLRASSCANRLLTPGNNLYTDSKTRSLWLDPDHWLILKLVVACRW